MILAGIDYSMTSPAVCVYNTKDPLEYASFKLYNLCKVKKYHGIHGNIRIDPYPDFIAPEDRFLSLADWAAGILVANGVEEAVLEGYAMGSTAGLVFQIAENTSVLKQKMHALGIPFTTPAPTQVKKKFAGSGAAKKEAMVQAFVARFGVDISKILGCVKAKAPENDIVDSVANMMMHPQCN